MRQLNLLPRERRLLLRRALALGALTSFVRSLVWSLLSVTLLGLFAGGGLALGAWWDGQADSAAYAQHIADYRAAQRTAVQGNQLVAAVDQLGRERLVWSRVLQHLLPVLPPGVTVDALQLDTVKRTVVVAGAAATRAEVVLFEDRLRQLPWVATLEAPRGNLLVRENARFTFTLSVDPSRLETPQP